MREEHRQLCLPVEGACPGQAFEEDAAEGVDVCSAVDRATLDLLGRHVVDCSDEPALTRQAADRRRVAGEPEVADVDVLAFRSRCNEDVGRLHVAVDEPRGMRGVECVGRLGEQVDRSHRIETALPSKEFPEIRALDVGHREVQQAVLVSGRERGDDVRMVDARGDSRLLEEASAIALVARQIRREHLQRESRPVGGFGQVDDARRPFADGRVDPKAGEYGARGELRWHGRHEVCDVRRGLST